MANGGCYRLAIKVIAKIKVAAALASAVTVLVFETKQLIRDCFGVHFPIDGLINDIDRKIVSHLHRWKSLSSCDRLGNPQSKMQNEKK